MAESSLAAAAEVVAPGRELTQHQDEWAALSQQRAVAARCRELSRRLPRRDRAAARIAGEVPDQARDLLGMVEHRVVPGAVEPDAIRVGHAVVPETRRLGDGLPAAAGRLSGGFA